MFSAPASCWRGLPVQTSPTPVDHPGHGRWRAPVSSFPARCQRPGAQSRREAPCCLLVLPRVLFVKCLSCAPSTGKLRGLRGQAPCCGVQAPLHVSFLTFPDGPCFGHTWGICSWPLHPAPAQMDRGPGGWRLVPLASTVGLQGWAGHIPVYDPCPLLRSSVHSKGPSLTAHSTSHVAPPVPGAASHVGTRRDLFCVIDKGSTVL